jgi:hypothetical protein
MNEASATATGPIDHVVGVFPTEASLEDAASRLTLDGFNRASLSRPPAHVPPEEAPGRLDAAPVLNADDRQQARTLGTSMSGAVAGMTAAGLAVATGGTAVVAAVAALGVGGVAAAATAVVQQGAQASAAEDDRASAELGHLTLSVAVTSPAQRRQAEAAMQAAGATDIMTSSAGASA